MEETDEQAGPRTRTQKGSWLQRQLPPSPLARSLRVLSTHRVVGSVA